jgi:hypothetical protein
MLIAAESECRVSVVRSGPLPESNRALRLVDEGISPALNAFAWHCVNPGSARLSPARQSFVSRKLTIRAGVNGAASGPAGVAI